MTERWIQDLLLPKDVYKSLEKPHIRGPLAFITVDAAPSYDNNVVIDSMKIKFGNPPNLKLSLSNHSTTPIDLIQLHDSIFCTLQSADTTSRAIESVGALRLGNDDINIMIDSPIKSLAWTLFLKATRQINDEDTRINVNFNKVIIARLGKMSLEKELPKTEILHLIKLIDPKKYKGERFEHFDRRQRKLLQLRVKIFNGCLKTAAKIFPKETGEEIFYTKEINSVVQSLFEAVHLQLSFHHLQFLYLAQALFHVPMFLLELTILLL
jgi:hypothetical protein